MLSILDQPRQPYRKVKGTSKVPRMMRFPQRHLR